MYKEFQKNLVAKLNENKKTELHSKDIFLNHSTLRLTKRGKGIMCKNYDSWIFESPGTKAQNTLSLLRKMTYPYYIDSKQLILFTEKDAFMARLAGAQGWLDGK